MEAALTRPPRNLNRGFSSATVCSFVIKTVGMVVSLIFAAADLVQFWGQIHDDVPDTRLNAFLDLLGEDTGDWKILAIALSILCNVVFNNTFISAFLDRGKSSWDVVGLQLLYFVLENIDNYAALCFGNISQDLVAVNPLLGLMVGLLFG